MTFPDGKFDGKVIAIEFVEGFNDGRIVRTDSHDASEFNEVIAYYDLSRKGTVGAEFGLTSWSALEGLRELSTEESWKAPLSRHIYRVIDREESSDTLTIRCEFVRVERQR